MGWSATSAACRTLERFKGDSGLANNEWTYRGVTYFYEEGEEQDDGAIIGEITRMIGPHLCRLAGTFRIEPDGTVSKAPFGLKERLEAGGKNR